MKRVGIVGFSIVVLLVTLPNLVRGAEDAEVRAAFAEFYRPHADALKRHYDNIAFVSEKHTPVRGKPGDERVMRLSGRFSWDRYILESGRPKWVGVTASNSSPEFVEHAKHGNEIGLKKTSVRNTRYSFDLIERDGNREIQRVDELTAVNPNWNPETICYMLGTIAYMYRNESYAEMIDDREIEFRNLEQVTFQNEDAMELTMAEPKSHTSGVLNDIKLTFATADGVLLRLAYVAPGDDKPFWEQTIEYEDGGAGRRPTARIKRDGDYVTEERILSFEPIEPLKESECQLSAFGFPEPVFAQSSSRWRLLVWGILLIVVGAAVAYYLRRRADAT